MFTKLFVFLSMVCSVASVLRCYNYTGDPSEIPDKNGVECFGKCSLISSEDYVMATCQPSCIRVDEDSFKSKAREAGKNEVITIRMCCAEWLCNGWGDPYEEKEEKEVKKEEGEEVKEAKMEMQMEKCYSRGKPCWVITSSSFVLAGCSSGYDKCKDKKALRTHHEHFKVLAKAKKTSGVVTKSECCDGHLCNTPYSVSVTYNKCFLHAGPISNDPVTEARSDVITMSECCYGYLCNSDKKKKKIPEQEKKPDLSLHSPEAHSPATLSASLSSLPSLTLSLLSALFYSMH